MKPLNWDFSKLAQAAGVSTEDERKRRRALLRRRLAIGVGVAAGAGALGLNAYQTFRLRQRQDVQDYINDLLADAVIHGTDYANLGAAPAPGGVGSDAAGMALSTVFPGSFGLSGTRALARAAGRLPYIGPYARAATTAAGVLGTGYLMNESSGGAWRRMYDRVFGRDAGKPFTPPAGNAYRTQTGTVGPPPGVRNVDGAGSRGVVQ